jgi:GxxExxY protein
LTTEHTENTEKGLEMGEQEIKKVDNLIYEEESYNVRGAVYEVYKEMGCGFLEAVYQECLTYEFEDREIPFVPQKELDIHFKKRTLKQKYIPDFICYDKIIIELKAAKDITNDHKAQVLNYLKATNMKLGLLVNFGHYPKVEIKRIAL